MELSKSAQEVLTQAQMLKLSGNDDRLCQEHILYGLLLMASYLDPPMNDMEYREEAKALRKFILTKMHCINAPKTKLRLSAGNDDKATFTEGSATIGRAAEIAGSRAITPMDLARAVFENPSPVTKVMMNVNISSPSDKKYEEETREKPPVKPPEKPPVQKPPQKPQVISQSDSVDHSGVSSPNKPSEPSKPSSDNSGIGIAELVQALHQLDQLNRVLPPNKPKKKTKLGLITYRGNLLLAAIQYFLLALLIPAGIAFAVEHFTGYVCNPPTQWAAFGVRVYLLLWAFFLCRGVAHVIGHGSKSFGLFLRMGIDLLLIAWLTVSVKSIFEFAAYPSWLKYVSGVLGVVVITVSSVLYDFINYKTYSLTRQRHTIKYGLNSSGRPAKVIFQNITRQLILPTAALIGIWAYPTELPDWQVKTFAILGFIIAWNIPNIIISCVSLATSAGWYRGSGEGFFKFLRSFYTFMFIPLMVLFLHWLFAWWPIKLWVIIVLGVYTLLIIAGSVIYAKD